MKIPNKFNRMGIEHVREALPPLTFTAIDANSSLRTAIVGSPNVSGLQYRTSKNGEWLTYTAGDTITLANVGDIVQFQNTANSLNNGNTNYLKFVIQNKQISASGNAMSLYNYSDTVPKHGFYNMFQGSTKLITAPELPAVNLSDSSYYQMFYQCTRLIKAPSILPATELKNYCYGVMFRECSSLAELPNNYLHSTSLENNCYYAMFYGCSKLEKAPELPATTLKGNCYRWLFRGCSKINSISVKFTSWTSGTTDDWVYQTASSGTFYKPTALPQTTGNNYIPSGWTVVNID